MKTLVFEFLNISKHRIIDKERELLKKNAFGVSVYIKVSPSKRFTV